MNSRDRIPYLTATLMYGTDSPPLETSEIVAVFLSRTGCCLLLAAACAGISCGGGTAPDGGVDRSRNNVILITVDTLRTDHVGAYGDRARTPNLDRLAAQGTVFERCISQTPLTLPSHATILSGTYPLFHGVRDNGGFVVPGELELVSETVQREGYATSAFVAAYVLHSKWGLDQGFDLYSDAFDRSTLQPLLLQTSKRANEVIAPAREWIAAHRERPFFTWIHLFDPHTPYDPPPPFDAASTSPYRGEVEYTDFVLGEFFNFLDGQDLLDHTLIIFTADHGEGLGEHGENEHGFFLYESTVHVPLIVRGPSEFALPRWDGPVEHVDLAPTILDWLGLPIPDGIQGRSLVPLLDGRMSNHRTTAYSETFYPRLHYGWSELRALYRNDLKYISAPRPELYDLRVDAGEKVDLAQKSAVSDELSALATDLERRVRDLSAEALDPSRARLTSEDRAALEALGYVTTNAPAGDDFSLADPKDKIHVFNRLADAAALLGEQRFDEAIAIASEASAADPKLVDAHVLLGNAYRGAGRINDAIPHYRRALDLKPDSNFAMIDLLSCLVISGSYDEAIQNGVAFLGTFPNDAILHEQVAAAYASLDEHELALHHIGRAVALHPTCGALTRAGELYLANHQVDAASASLRSALELDPTCRGAWFHLGRAADLEGNTDEALSHFRREVANHEDASMAAINAAMILAKAGRREDAVRYCRIAIQADPPFGLPYFMIAADFLARGTGFEEAIELCRRGIRAAPEDSTTLIGYETLIRLLRKTGNREEMDRVVLRLEALRRRLESDAAAEGPDR